MALSSWVYYRASQGTISVPENKNGKLLGIDDLILGITVSFPSYSADQSHHRST